MLAKIFLVILTAFILQSCSIEKLHKMQQASKSAPFEQVDFQGLIRRYMKKDKLNSIEGIYSVSGEVTKRSKGLLAGSEKEKTKDRKENYAKVAILRDPGSTSREFIELSLDKETPYSYSIIGEFNLTESGSLLLYKHMEGKGKSSSFTFTVEKNSDILEGVRVENEGNTTVTYKLTYVKLSTQ
jgi:hypothetical protein